MGHRFILVRDASTILSETLWGKGPLYLVYRYSLAHPSHRIENIIQFPGMCGLFLGAHVVDNNTMCIMVSDICWWFQLICIAHSYYERIHLGELYIVTASALLCIVPIMHFPFTGSHNSGWNYTGNGKQLQKAYKTKKNVRNNQRYIFANLEATFLTLNVSIPELTAVRSTYKL